MKTMAYNRTYTSFYFEIIIIVYFGCVITVSASTDNSHFGSLRLCPPGGPGFVYAWDVACDMKRRKKRSTYGSDELYVHSLEPFDKSKRQYQGYRPATLGEMMKICCYVGCEIRDLLAYCDPFSF